MADDSDPYNFTMEMPKKKKKKKEKKVKSEKKSISVEERMAKILKRTGSSLTTDFIASGGQESVQETEEKVVEIKEKPVVVQDDEPSVESDDSLGMEEADFEVGVYARRQLKETQELRLSQTSLKLHREEELEEKHIMGSSAPRYEQKEEISDFERMRHVFEVPADDAEEAAKDESTRVVEPISDFERMKHVFDLPIDEVEPKEKAESTRQTFELKIEPTQYVVETKDSPLYDDDDFEMDSTFRSEKEYDEYDFDDFHDDEDESPAKEEQKSDEKFASTEDVTATEEEVQEPCNRNELLEEQAEKLLNEINLPIEPSTEDPIETQEEEQVEARVEISTTDVESETSKVSLSRTTSYVEHEAESSQRDELPMQSSPVYEYDEEPTKSNEVVPTLSFPTEAHECDDQSSRSIEDVPLPSEPQGLTIEAAAAIENSPVISDHIEAVIESRQNAVHDIEKPQVTDQEKTSIPPPPPMDDFPESPPPPGPPTYPPSETPVRIWKKAPFKWDIPTEAPSMTNFYAGKKIPIPKLSLDSLQEETKRVQSALKPMVFEKPPSPVQQQVLKVKSPVKQQRQPVIHSPVGKFAPPSPVQPVIQVKQDDYQIQQLERQLKQSRDQAEEYNAELRRVKRQMKAHEEESTDELKRVKRHLKKCQEELDDSKSTAEKQTKKLKDELNQSQDEVIRFKTQARRFQSQLQQVEDSKQNAESLQRQMNEWKTQVEELKSQVEEKDTIEYELKRVKDQLQRTKDELKELEGASGNVHQVKMELMHLKREFGEKESEIMNLQEKLRKKESRLKESEQNNAKLKKDLVELEKNLREKNPDSISNLIRATKEVELIKKQLQASEEARQQLVATLNDSQTQTVSPEMLQELEYLREMAAKVPILQDQLMLAKRQASVPRTPSMVQFERLTNQITLLQQKHQARESELQRILTQTQLSSQAERHELQRAHEAAISVKNAEINRFRAQLDEMLSVLESLRVDRHVKIDRGRSLKL